MFSIEGNNVEKEHTGGCMTGIILTLVGCMSSLYAPTVLPTQPFLSLPFSCKWFSRYSPIHQSSEVPPCTRHSIPYRRQAATVRLFKAFCGLLRHKRPSQLAPRLHKPRLTETGKQLPSTTVHNMRVLFAVAASLLAAASTM